MSAPLVSVIVPMFDSAAFLTRAIRSLKAQSLGEIEVILVDNGSHDDTQALAETLVADDPRFSVIDAPGGRQGHARNAGLTRARGLYVAFLDSDDELEPQALESLYRLATTHDAEIAACGAMEVWPDGASKVLYFSEWLPEGPIRDHADWRRLADTAVVWSKLYRRDLLMRHAIRFVEGRIYEDTLFNYDAVVRAARAVYTRQALWLIHANPHSSTRDPRQALSRQDDFFAFSGDLAKRAQSSELSDAWRRYFAELLPATLLATYFKTPPALRALYLERANASFSTRRERVSFRVRLEKRRGVRLLHAHFPRAAIRLRELYAAMKGV